MVPNGLSRVLVRVGSLQGREVLENLITGQFETIMQQNGRVMITASATNTNFSYVLPSGMDPASITTAAEDALTFIDAHSEEEVARFLTSRRRSWARTNFY